MNYKHMLDDIKMEALSLQIGDSKRMDCPNCGHNRMDIKREDTGILYHCWRPSCDEKGFIGTITSNLLDVAKREKKVFTPKVFYRPTVDISPLFYKVYLAKYGIPLNYLHESGMRRVRDRDAVVMPLVSRQGLQYGHTTKYFLQDAHLKAIHYIETNVPVIHYCMSKIAQSTAVIVEDWLSAQKLRMLGYDSVALLGTTLNDDIVRDIRKAYETIIIMLDPDAWEKALKMRKKYALYFRECYLCYTEKDPKDYTNEILTQKINGVLNEY